MHHNQELLGGLVVESLHLGEDPEPLHRMQRSLLPLLELGEQENLINAHLMATARQTSEKEREKAEAIHLAKLEPSGELRHLYALEEPRLMAAIRSGDKKKAREVLNGMLVVVYHQGQTRFELLKSYLLELLCMMSRATVEAGADINRIWGLNPAGLQTLAQASDEEQLSALLVERFETLMEETRRIEQGENKDLMVEVRRYLEANLERPLKREEVARAVGFSESHFALMTTLFHRSFRELLTEVRLERAAEQLRNSTDTIASIALACGFADQSHFTRVFSRHMECSPGEYRKQGG